MASHKSFQEQHDDIEKKMQTYNEQLENKIEWGKAVSDYGAAISALIRQNMKAHQELIKKANDENDAKLKQCQGEEAKLQKEIQELNEKLIANNKELDSSKQALEKCKTELEAKKLDLNSEFKTLENKLVEAETQLQLAQQSGSDTETMLKTQVDALQLQLEDLGKLFQSEKNDKSQAESKVKELEDEILTNTEKKKEIETKLETLNEEMKTLNEANIELIKENKDLKEKLATLVATAQALVGQKHESSA